MESLSGNLDPATVASATMAATRPSIVEEDFERVKANPGNTRWTSAESEAFVDANYERIHAWFCWLTGRRDAAGDLTQETFAAFWSSLGRVPMREPRVWLYRIARNQWRKWCRNAARSSEIAAAVPKPEARQEDPFAVLADGELTERVAEFVLQLPSHYREAVTLRYWSDLSHKQIAEVLARPGPLIRWRLHHGCKLLREWLIQADRGKER